MWIITNLLWIFLLGAENGVGISRVMRDVGGGERTNSRTKGEDTGWTTWFLPTQLVPFFLLRPTHQIRIPEFSPHLSIILSSVHIVNTIIIIMSLFFSLCENLLVLFILWPLLFDLFSYLSLTTEACNSPRLAPRFSVFIFHSRSLDSDHISIHLSLFNIRFFCLKFHKSRIGFI